MIEELKDFELILVDLEYYPISTEISHAKHIKILPYSEIGSNQIIDRQSRLIGIGHSIGLLKLLQSNLNFSALFGLQSFLNFLHRPPLRSIRERNLKTMQKYLLSDPQMTLSRFHQQLGLSTPQDLNNLNLERLSADLNLLEQDFSGIQINCPLMIFYSNNDLVVPAVLSQTDFASYQNVCFKEIPEAQHALGFLKPADTAKAIREFINEQF